MLKTVLINAFDFRGQNSRLTYFLYGFLFPFLLLFSMMLMLLPYIEAQSGLKLNKLQMEGALFGMIAIIPFAIALMWVQLVQIIKRLRDMGHSGWWFALILLLGPLPYLGITVSLCFFALLLFYPGQSQEQPKREEWVWVTGALILLVAVIAIEALRFQKNGNNQNDTSNIEQNQVEKNTSTNSNSTPSSSTQSNDVQSQQFKSHLPHPNSTPALTTNSVVDQSVWKRKSYTELKNKFIDMGLCNACADNVALHVRAQKESQCSNLAIKALSGNKHAISTLSEDLPQFCNQ